MPIYSSRRLFIYSIMQHFSAPQPSTASVTTYYSTSSLKLHALWLHEIHWSIPPLLHLHCAIAALVLLSATLLRLYYIPLNWLCRCCSTTNLRFILFCSCTSSINSTTSALLPIMSTLHQLINSICSSAESGPLLYRHWLLSCINYGLITFSRPHHYSLCGPSATLYPLLSFTMYTTLTITPAPLLGPLLCHT